MYSVIHLFLKIWEIYAEKQQHKQKNVQNWSKNNHKIRSPLESIPSGLLEALEPLLGPPGATLGRVLGILGPPLRRPGPTFERSWPVSQDSCEGAVSPWRGMGWLPGAPGGFRRAPVPNLGTIWMLLGQFSDVFGTILVMLCF